ncbi:MAG TPA: DUF3795 domain-containing protein [Bacillota bacterium]|jgi:hypothetical protein|nr:DUF3795 domain-containing protein [Bacillota bacterium]
MKVTEENILAAPCGIACGECPAYKAKDNPAIMEAMVAKGIPREKLPCPGCRAGQGDCPVIEGDCATYQCVESRGVEFCFECKEFPCTKLCPASDRANILPHNTKVFNLCYIKEQGLERWLEKASEIQKRYYVGKMVVGQGPQIDN